MKTRWEYRVEVVDGDLDFLDIQTFLNELGKEGWRLIQIGTSLRTYFFKCPLPAENKV